MDQSQREAFEIQDDNLVGAQFKKEINRRKKYHRDYLKSQTKPKEK